MANHTLLVRAWAWTYGIAFVFLQSRLSSVNGSKNWVTIGGMTLFQPSEFMKIAYIIMLSRVIVTFHKYYPNRKIREDFMLIGYMTLFTIPVLILLALQKDLGTSLVFVAIFSGMLLLSGVSWKILLPTALTGIVLVGGFMLIFISPWWNNIPPQFGDGYL